MIEIYLTHAFIVIPSKNMPQGLHILLASIKCGDAGLFANPSEDFEVIALSACCADCRTEIVNS